MAPPGSSPIAQIAYSVTESTPEPPPEAPPEPEPEPSPSPEPDPTPDPEPSWSFDRTETSYAITDLTVSGPTYDVAPGTNLLVSGRVKWYSYSVYRTADGAEESRDFSEGDAASVSLTAAVESGDGSIGNSASSLTTGSDGSFQSAFVMGSETSRLSLRMDHVADVATHVDFVPPAPPEASTETFAFHHAERTIHVEVSTPSGVAPAYQATVVSVQPLETS